MASVHKGMIGSAAHPSPSKRPRHLQCISEFVTADFKVTEPSKLFEEVDYEKCGDLVNLPNVTDVEILQCLGKRYVNDKIYTSMRNHLISINPGRPLPCLYSRSQMERIDSNEAHIYAVGNRALKHIIEAEEPATDFVIISGESGSGKTENAKYLLKFLLHHNVPKSCLDASYLENSLLKIFEILEAFGNAPTTHNRNSSRFGKCVRVEYDDKLKQIGGVFINTFLLEKTRVLHLRHSPRTAFHVFDSMISMSAEERLRYFVDITPEDESRLPYIDWSDLQSALRGIRIDGAHLENVTRVLSALRLLADLHFTTSTSAPDDALLPHGRENDLRLSRIASLLGTSAEDLKRTLTQHKFSTRRESAYIRSCSVAEAETRIETFMKFMYQLLFHWLTDFCEEQFGCQGPHSIGIIDLYGFESLSVNGFEQLCINYANERLQQHFVESFLRATQAEYEDEGVPFDCSNVRQSESFETTAMIGHGLFPLLEEECRMLRVSASAGRLARRFDSEVRPKFGRALLRVNAHAAPDMLVRHYAGPVTYALAEFLPLNVDRMPADVFDCLVRSRTGRWLMTLSSDRQGEAPPLAVLAERYKQRPAVCSQFKKSLNALFELIKSCDHVSYVRCLKPRRDVGVVTTNVGAFDPHLVQQQLASCGISNTVRVCRQAVHPVRLAYETFHRRFAVLLSRGRSHPSEAGSTSPSLFTQLDHSFADQHRLARASPRSSKRSLRRRTCASEVDQLRRVCATILESWLPSCGDLVPNPAQFGRTRLFLTQAQADVLEQKRHQVRDRAACTLQGALRLWLRRRCRQAAAAVLQAHVRRWLWLRRRVVAALEVTENAVDPALSQELEVSVNPCGDEATNGGWDADPYRRHGILSRRYIPDIEELQWRGRARRNSELCHRLLPYSHVRPMYSLPKVRVSYKMSLGNSL